MILRGGPLGKKLSFLGDSEDSVFLQLWIPPQDHKFLRARVLDTHYGYLKSPSVVPAKIILKYQLESNLTRTLT